MSGSAARGWERWAIGPAALAWGLGLGGLNGLPAAGTLLLAGLGLILLGFLRALAGPGERDRVQRLYLLSLLIYTLEVLLLRQLPVWADDFPDAHRHHLNALALWRHWQGETLNAAEYRLRGLLTAGQAEWPAGPAGDALSYTAVLGMSRYLYQLYVAAIYTLTEGSRATAVFSHLPWMAGAAGGVYLLTLSLFRRPGTALLAFGLMLADANFAVWGSVLLRESLLIFLVVLAFLGMARLFRDEGAPARQALLTLGTLAPASLIRFNFVGAFLAALLLTGLSGGWPRRLARAGLGLAGLLVLLGAAAAVLRPSLEHSLPGQVVAEALNISGGGVTVFRALRGRLQPTEDQFMDRARQDWHQRLRDRPWWRNLGEAVWRSLLAPYPWGVFRHGFPGESFYELMIPGALLWMLCLPLFALAWLALPIRRDPALRLCLFWLLTQAGIYIIGYGEFSMRQRMMAEPLLWVFVARGVQILADRRASRRPERPA